jgi:N-acetylmuramoyl-L-alanine amidase
MVARAQGSNCRYAKTPDEVRICRNSPISAQDERLAEEYSRLRNDSVVISSAHGKRIRGARGLIDEVDQSREVVARVAEDLRNLGASVSVFHDDTSTTQSTNLRTIVAAHNGRKRDLDVSVHFNAAYKTDDPRGTEVLHRTQEALAKTVSAAIANASGLINRGAKKRTNLAFLNRTKKPAIVIEICFVDSTADVRLYKEHFGAICEAIARALVGKPGAPVA